MVLVLIALLSSGAAPAPAPRAGGECVETTVRRVGTRLTDAEGRPTPGSGTAIEFANGVALVSYETVAAAEESRPGDAVTLCLAAVPSPCPPGDERGRTYTVVNGRTHRSSR